MQQPAETMAFQEVISIERLVSSATGVRTPCLYYELKYMAINKDSDWRPVVRNMTEGAVLDRIKTCEVFLGDMLILRSLADGLERRATRLADLGASVGSSQHVEAKVRLLLVRGEDAVIQSDLCEDILLRALRRMLTMVEWGYRVSPFLLDLPTRALHSNLATPPSACRAACACTQSLQTGKRRSVMGRLCQRRGFWKGHASSAKRLPISSWPAKSFLGRRHGARCC